MVWQEPCAVVQCDRKHIKHKHVYFFWTVRDEEAVQYFTSTFAVRPLTLHLLFLLCRTCFCCFCPDRPIVHGIPQWLPA